MARAERGFSLLEALVAMTLLGLSLALLMEVFADGAHAVQRAEASVRATTIAQNELARLAASRTLRPGEESDRDDAGYAWQTMIEAYETPDVPHSRRLAEPYTVRVTVTYAGSHGEQQLTLETLMLTPVAR